MNDTIEILKEKPTPISVEPHKTFDRFTDAFAWAGSQCNEINKAGGRVIAAKVWQDRFKQFRPRDIQSQLLGIGKKAVNDCERIAPGGKWTIMVDAPSPAQSLHHGGGYQFSAWYSKYLPYAHAMMLSENGYKAFGIEFDCVNSFFGSCLGFVDIGQGHNPGMAQEEVDDYNEIFNESCRVKSPQLPFDEAFFPACCFVFINAPELYLKYSKPEYCSWPVVHKVAERLNGKLKMLAA